MPNSAMQGSTLQNSTQKKWLRWLIILTLFLTIITSVLFLKVKAYIVASTNQPTFAAVEPWLEKVRAYYYKVFVRSNTYEFLRRAYYTFGIPKKGLIHIGAREAEELKFYLDHNLQSILWIEADTDVETVLKQKVAKHPGSKVAIFAATNTNGTITLNQTSNHGDSSSILKPKTHLLHYPTIKVTKTLTVPQKRLDDYLSNSEKEKYNIITIDIQGAELIALKGAVETLKHIDAIIAEANYDELYKGCVLMKGLDEFLGKQGFTRVDTVSVGFYTGDTLYIKNKFFKPNDSKQSIKKVN